MGCMVQRMGEQIFRRVKNLDFAIGTHRLSSLPCVVDRVRAGETGILEIADEEPDAELLTGHSEGRLSAFVNILLGCNRRCTYCIVPAVRGREWSRPGESILREVRELAGSGVREVTLLGQSVMSYGRSNDVWPAGYRSVQGYQEPLPQLLEAVSGIEGIRRVRFTSGHPSGCTPELARAMSELDAVCPHLHLPVQSGADRILKLMRRGYTADDYRCAARTLRAAVPEVALTTDIIVGFPSETEEEFEATRAFMGEMEFDNAFIFKYSPRPGTAASELEDTVTEEEKMRRNKILLDDQDSRGKRINEGYVGRCVKVLAEGPSLRNETRWSGRSGTNKIVIFAPQDGVRAGDEIKVHINRAMAQTLYGDIVQADGKEAS